MSTVPQEEVLQIAQMAVEASDDGESEADFYKPVGLSPVKSRHESGTNQSDGKFFSQLQSHR